MANAESTERPNLLIRFLNLIEWVGNKLPDPVVLFIIGMVVVTGLSFWMSSMTFTDAKEKPIEVTNMLTLEKFAETLTVMVNKFVNFAPLGIVLVALLGVGVAERAGFINAVLKSMMDYTPKQYLTPMVILVGIVSHTATDAGYVLVIPLAGVMFYAAGRHPLAGIAAAFAGVSGGFSANFVPSGIDPMLSGITEMAAQLSDNSIKVNPLCNYFFTAVSSFLIIGLGWLITDYVVEPKLKTTPVDGDPAEIPKFEELSPRDQTAMRAGLATLALGVLLFTVWAIPGNSALRDKLGSLTSFSNSEVDLGLEIENSDDGITITEIRKDGPAAKANLEVGDRLVQIGTTNAQKQFGTTNAEEHLVKLEETGDESVPDRFTLAQSRLLSGDKSILIEFVRDGETKFTLLTPATIKGAPLVNAIVPIIFILFFFPGVVHGYVSGNFKNHRDVIAGMTKAMETMGYYIVLVFFVALFIHIFTESHLGRLLAIKGAELLRGQPPGIIICGIILLTAVVNMLIGSASAKWLLLSPIFVPMLMELGISPELAQAAYRIGDSSTNIITPLLPYFPLVVVFAQRYYTKTGIGTITSLMLPYSICFLIAWTIFLLIYWQLGIPLGIGGGYEFVKQG